MKRREVAHGFDLRRAGVIEHGRLLERFAAMDDAVANGLDIRKAGGALAADAQRCQGLGMAALA